LISQPIAGIDIFFILQKLALFYHAVFKTTIIETESCGI